MQDLQTRGKDVLLPVGCSDFDEWLLDALSVDRVLKQLKSGAPSLDLINACISTSTSMSARKDYLATPPRSSTYSGAEGGVVDYRALGPAGSPGGTPGLAAGLLEAQEDAHLPQLKLRSLQVGASGRGLSFDAIRVCHAQRVCRRGLASQRQAVGIWGLPAT
jgi:hypothetical protein